MAYVTKCQNFAWDSEWRSLGVTEHNLSDYFPHTFLIKSKTFNEVLLIRDTFLSDDRWTLTGYDDYEVNAYFRDNDDMMRMILQCI